MTNEQVLKILSEPPREEPLRSLTILLASLTDALDASKLAWDNAGPSLPEGYQARLFYGHQLLAQANDSIAALYLDVKGTTK